MEEFISAIIEAVVNGISELLNHLTVKGIIIVSVILVVIAIGVLYFLKII